MADLIYLNKLRGSQSLRRAIDDALAEHPDAKTGLIIIFDEKGGMHTYYRANEQQLAIASLRLAHLANRD